MQLSSYDRLTPENIIFNQPKEYKVKDSKIKYTRIPIEVKYPNGKKGALVIETPLLFSFGVSAKKNQETNKIVGYSIPVQMSQLHQFFMQNVFIQINKENTFLI